MLLNARIIKLASITQNNHVYEYTAEGPTPKVLLNVKSPYRRQKRDSIIRSSFRRPYTRIEIPAINTIISLPTILITSYLLPIISSTSYLPTFLPSCDHTDYFLSYYLLTITSTTSYLLTFLPFCEHTDYQITHTHSANQSRAGFTIPRHNK
jgi:hypothetical protein